MSLGEGETRCGVYTHRPSVCRAYPMAIWNLKVHQLPNALCPPGAWPEREVRRPAWVGVMQRLYMHFDVYNEVVARWNARLEKLPPGSRFSLSDYFNYLLNVYERFDVLAGEVGEEELARIQGTWPTAPRPNIDYSEMHIRSGDLPWLDYLLRVRGVIDGFFPEVEPQPLLAFMPTYTPANTSDMPQATKAKKREGARSAPTAASTG
jgi:hypothetical protein